MVCHYSNLTAIVEAHDPTGIALSSIDCKAQRLHAELLISGHEFNAQCSYRVPRGQIVIAVEF